MKWVRYIRDERPVYGIVEGDVVRSVDGDPMGTYRLTGESVPLDAVRPIVPFDSSKVIGIGLNYRCHLEEMVARGMPRKHPTEPVLFFKAATSILSPDRPVLLPRESTRVEYESEIGFYVKRRARRVPVEQAADYIFGYTCVNDVTARDLQKSDVQWTRAKSFDTFCPVGPVVETSVDISKTEIRGLLNGTVVQRSTGDQMIFDPPALLSFISQCFTLNPGDLVATGTPAGVGPLSPGDRFTVRVSGIGELSNPVEMEAA